MIVIAASRVISLEPSAVDFIEVFADVRLVVVPVLRFNVGVHRLEIVALFDRGIGVVPQNIRQGRERLRRRKRPDGAVPFAIADAMRAEFGMPAFSGGDSKWRPESLRIDKLRPGTFIPGVGKAEIPRD